MSPALPEALRAALENLASKQAGKDVGFINIADARALTALGFAVRHAQGWTITAAGAAVLTVRSDAAPPPVEASQVLEFPTPKSVD